MRTFGGLNRGRCAGGAEQRKWKGSKRVWRICTCQYPVLLNEQTPGGRMPAARDSSNPRALGLQPQPPRRLRSFASIAASAAVRACHHVLASRLSPRARIAAARHVPSVRQQGHLSFVIACPHLCLASGWSRRTTHRPLPTRRAFMTRT